MTAADLLRRAADGFRTGAIRWGQEFYVRPDGCRCTLGGIAWAADPQDADGDPRWVTPVARFAAQLAADTLARYLVDELDAGGAGDRDAYGTWHLDPVETVGGWNDAHDRTVFQVVAALEAAAELAARTAVPA